MLAEINDEENGGNLSAGGRWKSKKSKNIKKKNKGDKKAGEAPHGGFTLLLPR